MTTKGRKYSKVAINEPDDSIETPKIKKKSTRQQKKLKLALIINTINKLSKSL